MPPIDAQAILQFIAEKWAEMLITLAIGVVGWTLGKRRARGEWKKRQFFGRLNVSLNYINEGTLRIRTIFEKPLSAVFINQMAAEMVEKAARRTTEDNPILELPKQDYWFVNNEVLNSLAEFFCQAQIKRDLGLPATRGLYLICLTCEKAGDVRTQKVRAMMMRKEVLLNLPAEDPQLESPFHSTRIMTLRKLARDYAANPDHFIEMEIWQ